VCGESNGDSGVDGVWVVDQSGDPMPIRIKTGWIRSSRMTERASVRRGYLTMRETGIPTNTASKMQVEARTNFRDETISSTDMQLYPEVSAVAKVDTTPGIWSTDADVSAWDDGKKWRRRRVFKCKFDIDLQSCETYQLEFTCTRRVEVLNLTVEEQDRATGGASTSR
jgi:hypothetical protein